MLSECSNVNASLCLECYTGQKDCSVCDQPGECQGNVVDDFAVPSVDECKEECFNNENCFWYTYDVTLSYCLLTTNCQPKNSSVSKVFGQKSCYQQNITNPSILIYTCISLKNIH